MDEYPDGYYWAVDGKKDEPVLIELQKIYFLGDDYSYTFDTLKNMGIKLYPMAPRVEVLP